MECYGVMIKQKAATIDDNHNKSDDTQAVELTRREFLKKSAAGVGVVAGYCLVGGCGTNNEQSTGKITARLLWRASQKTTAKTVASAPLDVTTVRIIVSGPGISPAVQKDFSAAAGSGTIDGIPVGAGRTVTVQGLNSTAGRLREEPAEEVGGGSDRITDEQEVAPVDCAAVTFMLAL